MGRNAATVFSRQRLTPAAACVVALLLAVAPAAAQTEESPGFEHGLDRHVGPWQLPSGTSRAEAAELAARWKALAEELKSSGDDYAGPYKQYGTMRSHYLRWSPRGGFVYLYVYEDFAVIDISYGRVERTPAGVVFRVERELREKDARGRPRRMERLWVPARWKGEDYLVPEARVRDFGNYVAGLGEYNDFNGPCCEFAPFLSRVTGDEPSAGDGRPVVPERYGRLMRRPVEATVVSVGRRRSVKDYGLEGEFYSTMLGPSTLTPVRLSAGRASGIRAGLLLRIVGGPGGQYLKVTRVGRRRSDALLIRDLSDDGGESCVDESVKYVACPPLAAGAKLTTSPR